MLLQFIFPALSAIIIVTNCLAQDERPLVPLLSSNRFGVKYDEALEAIFSIAVRLEALLTDTGSKTSKNFIVSPLSIATAVGQLMLGTKDRFLEELHDLLIIDSVDKKQSHSVRHNNHSSVKYFALHEQLADLLHNLRNHGEFNNHFELKTASILFIQNNLTINEQYKTNVKSFYNTDIEQINFLDTYYATYRINKWVSDNTNGLIKSIGGISAQTVALLANAVYFKADWEIPFSSQINRILPFKTGRNSSVNTVFMMGEFENYKYVENERLNCKMVVIPYKNDDLAMYIVLPNPNKGKEYDINAFVGNLKTTDITELIYAAVERKVFMLLPKMSLSNTIKVLGPLKRYLRFKNQLKTQTEANIVEENRFDRLSDRVKLFKNSSAVNNNGNNFNLDIDGISNSPEFELGELIAQTTLTVHEFGTEAAAVAASIIDYILDSVSVRVDRPFLFFIRHKYTEATLFWGTIQDPTEKNPN